MFSETNGFAQTTFAFVDVETTGLSPHHDRVVDVACVLTRDGRRLHAFASLIDPQRPIPATASAIHHLTDECVGGAPTLEAVTPHLRRLVANAVVVAHNAAFDVSFLPFLRERPVLCSMRFAQRVVPEAPNHKNQVLRYHLGVRDAALSPAMAHRALGDAMVTSLVFEACVKRHLAAGGLDDVPRVVAATMAPRELPAFAFGRHRGKPIADIPADYLAWVAHEAASPSHDARHTAHAELQRRHLPFTASR